MEFVDFNLAKKLKEKGFKEKCIAYYWEKINEHTPSFVVEDNMPEDGINLLDLLSNHNQAEWSPFIDAPTISQVSKWLIDEKNIYIEIFLYNRKYSYLIKSTTKICEDDLFHEYLNSDDDSSDYEYEDPEGAMLAGIKYVLDNLI